MEAVGLYDFEPSGEERITAKYMDVLINLDSVNSDDDLSSLRSLYDCVEGHTRELRALGVAQEAYNCLLPSVLMRKL